MIQKTSKLVPRDKHQEGIERYLESLTDADIRLLRIFNIVVAAGGLSAATVPLQADLSTVSRYIKELESKIGLRLCDRGRSGFALTENGKQVHRAANTLFLALQSFREEVSSLSADPVGVLRVGMMDAMLSETQLPIANALRTYKQKARRTEIHLTTAKPNDIERALLTGDLDVGIVATQKRMSGLRYHLLYKERSNLYCSQAHTLFSCDEAQLGLSDISQLELVEDPYTESLPIRGSFGILRKAASAGSIESVAMLIHTGNYVGFLPDHYAKAIAHFLPMRALRPDLFCYEQGIELCYRQDNTSSFLHVFLREMGIKLTSDNSTL